MSELLEDGTPARAPRPPRVPRSGGRVSMRRNWWTLIITVVTVSCLFAGTFLAGWQPQLGLDLQGGLSVRLGPVGKFDTSSLDYSKSIIERRINSLGVAESEVKREGNDIVVDLPGVKNRDQAARIVGKTAELTFRPVIGEFLIPPAVRAETAPTTTTTAAPTTTTTTASTTTTAAASTTGSGGGPGKSRPAQNAGPTPTTTAPPQPLLSDAQSAAIIQTCDVQQVGQNNERLRNTSDADDLKDKCVLLPVRDAKNAAPAARMLLGPAALTGSDVKSARANIDQQSGYVVDVQLTGSGADKFNKLAAESFPKKPPQNSVAIALDGLVYSAPAFQTSNFAGGNVQISGNFSQGEATDLANLIKFGALPVKLKQLTATSVSPTLGRSQLQAGLLAGAVGLALVMLYVLLFYRILGLVIWFGLAITGMLVWTAVAALGQGVGLALTIAGVCGLIVSVGVTVDSYVVYYERLKDETRGGRTIRAAVDRGFQRSFRTILLADGVSILSALVLFFLAEGNVKGFAAMLAISVFLDIFVAYFVMRPLVSILGHKPAMVRARWIGLAAGIDAKGTEA